MYMDPEQMREIAATVWAWLCRAPDGIDMLLAAALIGWMIWRSDWRARVQDAVAWADEHTGDTERRRWR
jgi:hypothetical protein